MFQRKLNKKLAPSELYLQFRPTANSPAWRTNQKLTFHNSNDMAQLEISSVTKGRAQSVPIQLLVSWQEVCYTADHFQLHLWRCQPQLLAKCQDTNLLNHNLLAQNLINNVMLQIISYRWGGARSGGERDYKQGTDSKEQFTIILKATLGSSCHSIGKSNVNKFFQSIFC